VLRLNKKTEYALLALRYLSQRESLASARVISSWYNIPEMLMAKVLQLLKRAGLVDATKGASGGYQLTLPLSEVALIDVLNIFNEQVQIVECLTDEHDSCQQQAQCDIRGPLEVLNEAITAPLQRMSVGDLFREGQPGARPRVLSIYR